MKTVNVKYAYVKKETRKKLMEYYMKMWNKNNKVKEREVQR